MRILKINGVLVDIDDTTSIGIDFQAYEISNPANRKPNISNNFSIPKTAKNMALLGFPGNPHSNSSIIYDKVICDYWIDSVQLIKKGTARITDVKDRISFFVFEKAEFWDLVKDYKWSDFLPEFLAWAQIPKFGAPFIGTFSDFIQTFIDATENVHLGLYLGNFTKYEAVTGSYLENTSKIYMKYNNSSVNALGGHLSIYYKSIFKFLEHKYGISFNVESLEVGNLFTDAIASKMYCPARNISINPTATNDGFYLVNDESGLFKPEDSTKDKADKTLGSLITSFFQHFNAILEPRGINEYFVARFDDIKNSEVIDLSGKLSGNPEFYPLIDGWNQNNYIKFKDIPDGVDPLTNSKNIICANKSLDAGTSDSALIEIDGSIPKFVYDASGVIPLLDDGKSFGTFHFFIDGQNTSCTIKMLHGGTEYSTVKNLKMAALYSLNSEYITLATMMYKPIKYIIKKYLTLLDVANLKYFKRYWLKELNGYFFLNKINGYNPDKSMEATQIELIKIQ